MYKYPRAGRPSGCLSVTERALSEHLCRAWPDMGSVPKHVLTCSTHLWRRLWLGWYVCGKKIKSLCKFCVCVFHIFWRWWSARILATVTVNDICNIHWILRTQFGNRTKSNERDHASPGCANRQLCHFASRIICGLFIHIRVYEWSIEIWELDVPVGRSCKFQNLFLDTFYVFWLFLAHF